MYIKKVTGSIKGGVDAALTEKTLIVGPNGAGKSAIVNAVELALAGGASDIEGRAWVQDAKRLGRLGDAVRVEATLSDDTVCSFRVNKGKTDHQNGVGGSLPYREVRDALTGSPAKAYKFLLGQCASGLTLDDVITRIPLDLQDLYRSVAYGTTIVESLLEAQEVGAKKARDSAKEAKGARQAADLAAQGLGPMVLEAQVVEADLIRQVARQYEASLATRQQVAKCTNDLEEMKGRREILTQSIQKGIEGVIPSGVKERVDTLIKVIGYHVERASPSCGVCGGTFNPVVARQSMDELEGLQRKIAMERTNGLDVWQRELAEINSSAARIQKFLLEQKLRLDPVDHDGGITLQKAEEDYRRLTERVGAHSQHQKLQGHIGTLDQQAEKWKALATLLDSLVKDFVDAGMLKLMVRVQGFLSESDVFGMTLTKSDCQIGFIREGVLTTALSGAEWARLLVAIACACASDGVPVVIPEERMWDRETLAKTMRALSKAPCQIILTSTEKPKGKMPAGWSVVEVGQI